MYDALNRNDIGEEDVRYPAEIWRRVLRHLGDNTARIMRALNVRPLDVRLLEETRSFVSVRISTNVEHLVLKFVPEGSLAAEVACYRAMTEQQVPAPRVIHYDESGTLAPCPYALETYFGGVRAAQVADEQRLRVVARQVGRALRRMHRASTAGFGYPAKRGSWSASSWRAALTAQHNESGAAIYGALLLSAEQWAALKAATLDEPLLDIERPRLVHGNLRPEKIICTLGHHAQLEALVDPGPLIGGDPMYDLAWALLPSPGDAFREGMLEGYTALAPITPAEQARLERLHMLVSFWEACRLYAIGDDHKPMLAHALEQLVRYAPHEPQVAPASE